MKIRDYFLLGLSYNLDKKRHWVNSLISIVVEDTRPIEYPCKLIYEDDTLSFIHPETQERVYIDDYIPGREPIHFRDAFELKPNDIQNYKGDGPAITTYGNVFVNHLCIVTPGMGDLIEFQFGTIKLDKLENRIFAMTVDDDDEAQSPPAGKVFVKQYLMFTEYSLSLVGYAIGLITPLSDKGLTGHPDRVKIRDEWVEKNKDRLTDPTAIAELNDILDALDKEWLKGDASEDYYASSAKLKGARRMVHYTTGGEAGFGDGTKIDFIPRSLEEGTDVTKLSTYNNSTRTASYNRGHQTALGGESTKTIYRMVGNVRVTEEDCKSHIGVLVKVDNFNRDDLEGYTQLINGKQHLIDKETLATLVGKVIEIRSPGTCKTTLTEVKEEFGRGKNICAVCAGVGLAENPNGIPAAAAGVGGVFLTNSLKMMHNTELKVAKWNLNEKIT